MKLFPSINFWEHALIIRKFIRILNKATIEKKGKLLSPMKNSLLWKYIENNNIKKPSELNEYFVDLYSYDDGNECINLNNLEEYNINKIHDILNYIKNKINEILF